MNKLTALAILLCQNQLHRTALNKMLYFADAASMVQTGEDLSKAEYWKLPFGPVPGQINTIRDQLVKDKVLQETRVVSGSITNNLYRTIDQAAIEQAKAVFSAAQIELIDRVRTALAKYRAGRLSELSHEFEPWKSSHMDGPMDFSRVQADTKLRQWLHARNIL